MGHCYVWCEKDGLRGSNEIGSCVYHYLESLHKEGIKKVILFSDACGGQNRNKNMLSMLWYARHKFSFDSIEHIFFVTGHSQNEGDSMHSTIERKSKKTPIYTPCQWAQSIKDAKKREPVYIVNEIDHSFFLDLGKLSAMLKNFEIDTQRQRIQWLKVRKFHITSEEPNIVKVFLRF